MLAQRWAERKRHILLIVPATLRKQWQQELEDKFFLPSVVIDAVSVSIACSGSSPATRYAVRSLGDLLVSLRISKAHSFQTVPWDLVVIDEAHRLRNVYKSQSTMAGRITAAIRPAHKLLLTATPLQNTLMELYGLVSVIDEHVFGTLTHLEISS